MAKGKFVKNRSREQERDLTWQVNLVTYLHDIVSYVIVILVVFLLFFRVIVVSGSSMYPTLVGGDYLLLLSNVFYREPQQGDIVVVSKESYDSGTPIVKRIIATEGQIVDIDFANGIVYVDGIPLEEPYLNTPTNREEGMAFPMLIEKNCCFVMGDNRNNSKDSRHPQIGQVDIREILGKAIFLIVPAPDQDSPRDLGRIGAIN